MKVFVFESTRAVIKAEKIIRSAAFECIIIPVPRSISPNCGMALQIEDKNEAAVLQLFAENSLRAEVFDRAEVSL